MTKRGRRARWLYRCRRRIGYAKSNETLRQCRRSLANYPADRIYDHDSTVYPKYRTTNSKSGERGKAKLADYQARPRFVMDWSEFWKLPEYSWSTPTGVIIGKMWRAHQRKNGKSRKLVWWIYRYEEEPDQVTYPNTVRNARYVPVLRNRFK